MANALLNQQLDDQIKELCIQINRLDTREAEVENSDNIVDSVEKLTLLRKIRIERRNARKELADLSAERALRDYESSDDEAEEEEEADPDIAADQQALEDDNTSKYNRLINLCIRTKRFIREKKEEIETTLKEESTYMTDNEKRSRKVKIKTVIRTVNQQVAMYKDYSKDVMKLCNFEDVEQQQQNLNEVLEDANYITCLFEASEDREKQIEGSSSSGASGIISKFNPNGLDKFIKYKSFMAEYRQFVLSKPISPLIKLRQLHNSVEGPALKLVQSYTLADQLQTALDALEHAYNKPELVVAELYRHIRNLPMVSSFSSKTIAVAREQVCILKVSIATLKSMGYGDDLVNENNLNNSFLLLEIEGKVPMFVHRSWADEKRRLKSINKQASIEDFTNFYEQVVESNNDALYTRDRLEELSGHKDKNKEKPNKDKDKDKSRRSHVQLATQMEANRSSQSSSPKNEDRKKDDKQPKPYYPNAFCIFHEAKGHNARYCRKPDYTMEFKKRQVAKHQACSSCFKTGHKSAACEYRKECIFPSCKEFHHPNMHTQQEFKDLRNSNNGDKNSRPNNSRANQSINKD